jgi:hypothetical protein
VPYKDPEKQREYQRRWMANRRAEFFKGKCCVKCGATKNLEIDHINPETKIDHRVWSWSQSRRDAELAKCQVLCAACHELKTTGAEEHVYGEGHGSTKLTHIQVLTIRARYATGRETLRSLAREYRVANSHIHRIVHRTKRSRG